MIVHSKIQFDAATHTYTLDGRKLRSTTSVVKSLTPEFDSAGNAARVAEREGKPVAQVLAEWKAKGQAALDKGRAVHAAIEAAVKGEAKEPRCCLPEFVAWLAWWSKAGASLEVRATEKVVGDAELGVAGTLDALFWSRKTDALHIFDWKNCREFHEGNPWGRFLLPPFDDLPDCELEMYSLQVSLYRLVLERDEHTGLLGESWLVNMNRTAIAYKAKDYRRRLERTRTRMGIMCCATG